MNVFRPIRQWNISTFIYFITDYIFYGEFGSGVHEFSGDNAMDGSGSGMDYLTNEVDQNMDNVGRTREDDRIRNIEFQFPVPQIIDHFETKRTKFCFPLHGVKWL